MTLRFLDTNILLYAVGNGQSAPTKTSIAQGLLERLDCALSVQVLQEFYVQALRPTRPDAMSQERALDFIEVWSRFPVQSMSLELFHAALGIKARYRLSYWDAAIVAAAQALGCETLYSEDMAHRMTIGSTTIVNPFL